MVYCWYCGVVEPRVETRKHKYLQNDKFGYPAKYLKPQWRSLLQLIIRYITCDNRFSFVHIYHLRLLMALKGSKIILPHFLLNSLEKMASAVQNAVENQYHNLFHHGLVNILVQYQLSLNGENSDQFLARNNFGQNVI